MQEDFCIVQGVWR